MLEKVKLIKAVMADDFETDDDMEGVKIENADPELGKELEILDEFQEIKNYQKLQKKKNGDMDTKLKKKFQKFSSPHPLDLYHGMKEKKNNLHYQRAINTHVKNQCFEIVSS
jgi:hypothetical protein